MHSLTILTALQLKSFAQTQCKCLLLFSTYEGQAEQVVLDVDVGAVRVPAAVIALRMQVEPGPRLQERLDVHLRIML
jgi:hypothetical protein